MKKIHAFAVTGFMILFFGAGLSAKEGKKTEDAIRAVELLNANYNRTLSHALVRRIHTPTRANLDYAAYSANVMLFDSTRFDVKPPTKKNKLKDLNFGGTLVPSSLCLSLKKVPVPQEMKTAPMHWAALKEYLANWDFEKAQALVEAGNRVAEEKWGNDDAYLPMAELTDLYLDCSRGGPCQIWAKVEFKPWAKIFPFINDEDKDGFPEFYGQIQPALLTPDLIGQVKDHYFSDRINQEEVLTWADELASFWYPSYNTDLVHSSLNRQWPNTETESEVRKEMGSLTVSDPVMVMRGKPFGVPIYNVLVVDNMQGEKIEEGTEKNGSPAATPSAASDPSVQNAIRKNRDQIADELKANGNGFWDLWAEKVTPFAKDIRKQLKSRSKGINGLEGKDGFIFFDRSLEYLAGGDLQKQPEGKNPFPVIVSFARLLDTMGIHFLFVPVPVKPAVYPEKISTQPLSSKMPVDVYGRKFIQELSLAGVEVLDLYPAFLAEKDRVCTDCEPIYQKQDTHWTRRGLELASAMIGERIKQYAWYGGLSKTAFTTQEAKFQRMGDIVSRLEISAQSRYRPAALTGHQVLFPDGTLYKDKAESPILILGDSFTGVYQRTDCKHAGVSAHIAKNIQSPTHLIMSYGGGPTVIQQLKKGGKGSLAGKKLVIWIMVERDLFDYYEKWEEVTLGE